MITTIVQPGQTLSSIAASHGMTLSQIEQHNPSIHNPNLIYAGQAVSVNGTAWLRGARARTGAWQIWA